MAIHANHITILIFGFIFLINQYSTLVVADSFKLNDETVDNVQPQPGKRVHLEKTDHVANLENNANILQNEENENDSPILQGRDITNGGVDFGSSGNMPFRTSFSTGGGKRLQLFNVRGITIRAVDLKNRQNIMISNNQIFVGGKLVCNDIFNLDNEVRYRKSSDGTYWYTNIKMGEPMTPAEIEEFENDWAEYEKEKAEKKRQKQAAKQKRKGEKRAERERKRQRKEADKKLKEEGREIKRTERAERKERARKEKEAAKERKREAKEFARTGKKQRNLDDDEY